MRKTVAFIPIIAAMLLLFALSSMPHAFGQETQQYRYARDKTMELQRVPDAIGVVLSKGMKPDDVEALAGRNQLELGRKLQDNSFAFTVREKGSRASLERQIRAVAEREQGVVKSVGFLVTKPGSDTPILVTNHVIVQFKKTLAADRAREAIASLGATIVKESPYPKNRFVVEVGPGTDALDVSNRLFAMSDLVDYAQPDFVTPIDPRELIPSDPLFGLQWEHRNVGQRGGVPHADIETTRAWDIGVGAARTIIAVIDLGFEVDHPDIAQNVWTNPREIPGNNIDDDGNGYVDDVHGWDFVDNDAELHGSNDRSGTWHGVPVAGAAAARADNGIGIAGSCPNCQVMLLRIALSDLSNVEALASAFNYATANGASVITDSWGIADMLPFPDLVAAVDDAAANGRGGLGSVVLFAMRNEDLSDCSETSTSSMTSVIAVSGSTNMDRLAGLGYGTCMSLLAPTAWLTSNDAGLSTLWMPALDAMGPDGYNSTGLDGRCAELSAPPSDALNYSLCFVGNSAATPLVAGVAGLVLTEAPALGALAVRRLLQDTADKIDPDRALYAPTTGFATGTPLATMVRHGWGRVNAFEAVRTVAPAARSGHAMVDLFMRDNALDWGNTGQPSTTKLAGVGATIPATESMDVKVDAPPFGAPLTAETFDAIADETPAEGTVNKVYVRIRNRGPATAADATVKLVWAPLETTLPPLPADFWTSFPGDAAGAHAWTSVPCATGAPACFLSSIAYSGASVAGRPGEDAAQVATFDWPVPAADQAPPAGATLVALVDSPQDPVSPTSRQSLLVQDIVPRDNNITQRNYGNLALAQAAH
jgi:subtilisin family serine protease